MNDINIRIKNNKNYQEIIKIIYNLPPQQHRLTKIKNPPLQKQWILKPSKFKLVNNFYFLTKSRKIIKWDSVISIPLLKQFSINGMNDISNKK